MDLISFHELINCDFNSICAICNRKLNKEESCPLQQIVNASENPERQIKVYDVIKMLANFERIKIGNLPEKICMECFQGSVKVYEFHEKCKRSVDNIIHYWLMKCEDDKITFKEELPSEESEDDESYKCINIPNESINISAADSFLVASAPCSTIKEELETNACGEAIIIFDNSDMRETESANDYICHLEDIEVEVDSKGEDCVLIENSETKDITMVKAKLPMNLQTKGHWAKYQKVQCDICNQHYRKKYLPVHMRTHTRERPYKCEICSQLFRQQGALKTHMMTHVPDPQIPGAEDLHRPFVCKTCDKHFKTRSVLVKHEKIHLPVLPYNCNMCDKRFCRQDSLREHIDIVHNKIRHVCQVCNKPYTKLQYLKKHQKLSNHQTTERNNN